MGKGEGKGWAKGRTAATDARIARNAERRRGATYRRHRAPADDRRYRHGSARTLPLEWSDTMAYVVGLLATDGNLSRDGRHIAFDSGDPDLIATFLTCLGHLRAHVRAKRSGFGSVHHQVQFSDVRFHRWLAGIGLSPRKSLVLGAIDVPDEHIAPLARGLFEGDGHISNFTHAPTPSTYPGYRYERLWVYFNCASRAHLVWLQATLGRTMGLRGHVEDIRREGRRDFFRLKFGKRDSIELLSAMYPDPSVPKLERKWKVWAGYQQRMSLDRAVPREGFEPSRPCGHSALNATRLPVTPPRRGGP